MKALTDFVRTLWNEEDGVTAIEYGLIASLIAIGIATTATSIGVRLVAIFGNIATKLGG